jgi:tetratricopeptide (TPR) repeat protein
MVLIIIQRHRQRVLFSESNLDFKDTIMKKSIFIIIVMFIVSCGKELDLDPATSVDSEQAKKSIDLLMTGAYALIGSGAGATGPGVQEGALYSTDLLLNADLLAAENYVTWRGTFDQYKEVSNKLMSPTNSSITRMWVKGYAAINLANVILKHLDNAPEADRDYYKANALFIRGIVHFELLRFWMEPSTGLGIPIMTKPTEDFGDIEHPSRATIDDCYAAVINDLKEAKDLLPEENDVYANYYTVTAFLARIYLQKGDYANALAASDEVIESGNYELPTSVEEAFNTSSSPESIFDIQQNTQNNAGTNNDGLTTFYACDDNTPGSAGRGDIQIEQEFINEFDDPDDKRLTLLIYEGNCSKGSITSAKWHDPYANVPVIRLSEMYLIRAEANERLGSSLGDTPLNDVNAIRAKAGATLYGSVTLDDILKERELELAFEGQRIHDFKRLSKQIIVGGNTIDYTDPQFILPIPQSQLNTNKNIEQNTYYK